MVVLLICRVDLFRSKKEFVIGTKVLIILANWKLGRSFEPAMAEDVRNSKIKGWHRAVKCARIWAEDREN